MGEGGEGFGGGRIRREDALLEHRTLDPVTLHQGVKAKGAGGLDS